jgi:hypothetical protein
MFILLKWCSPEPRRNIIPLTFLLFISFSFHGFAQRNKYFQTLDDWSVGLKFGSNHYSGDLSRDYLFFPSVNMDGRNGTTVGAYVSKRINNTYTLRLDGEVTQLHDAGNNYYREYFNSTIFQANVTLDVDLFYVFFKAVSRFKILPYAGAGLTFYNASVYDRLDNRLMRDTNFDPLVGMNGLSQDKKVAFNIPVGLKISQRIGQYLEVGADFRINNTMTDKLDATVGGQDYAIYQTALGLDSNPHDSWYDAWGYLGLSVAFKIPPSNPTHVRNARFF